MKGALIAMGVVMTLLLVGLLWRSLDTEDTAPLYESPIADENINDDDVQEIRRQRRKGSGDGKAVDQRIEIVDPIVPLIVESGEHEFRVRVIDRAGRPVAGCQLFLMSAARDESSRVFSVVGLFRHVFRDQEPRARQMTDAQGVAMFSGLVAGAYKVSAFKDGFAAVLSEVIHIVAGVSTPVIGMTLTDGHVASGVVVDEAGRPIEGAEVVAVLDPEEIRDTLPTFRTVTAADGSFRFATLSDQETLVYVRADGYSRGGTEDFTPDKEDLRIVLSAAGQIKVHLFDEATGVGIDDAEVTIWKKRWISHGVAKGKGIYLLDGIPRVDRISLFVVAPNHGFAASLDDVGMLGAARFGRMVEPGEETRIEVPMASLGSIYGRVVDAQTGEGVSAASVQVLSGESDQVRMSFGLTDAEGEYRIQGLAAGSVTIYVRSPGYEAESVGAPFENDGDASSLRMMAVHGEAVAAPLIQLKLGRIVSGHCLDVAGNPVEGALVSYRSVPTGYVVVDKMLAVGNTMCASTTDGHFELSGLPTRGEIVLSAVHIGFPGGGKTTASEGASEDLIIVLKQGGAIHGQVLRADGTPVAGIGVHAAPGGENSITDTNGEFVLAAVAGGEVTLSIESGISQRLDAVEAKVKVIDGEVARITMQIEAMPSIRGRVLDESGVPIAGAAIRISASSGAAVESDSNGEFVLQFLTEGQHTLFVWRDGYRSVQVSGVDAGERNVAVTLRANQ